MDRSKDSLPNLDHTFNYVQWKRNVDQELASLQERVALLEGETNKKSATNAPNERHIVQAESSTKYSNEFAGDAISFTERLKTERTARFQCLWLLICIICFLYFGIYQLNVADMNEKSQWKPESKRYVLDYTSSEEQFKMPYLWINFFLELVNKTTSDDLDVNKTISQVMNSSFLRGAKISYLQSNFSWVIRDQEIKEDVGSYSGLLFGTVGIMVRISLSDPGILVEDWQTILRINILSLSFNDTYKVRYLKAKVARTADHDLSKFEFINYDDDWSNFDNYEVNQVFFIEYKEKVTKMYDSEEEVSMIESELTQEIWARASDIYARTGFDVQKGDVVINFKPDLSVEHWIEYVSYGYLDWVTGMGGLFSLMTTIFFWFAYYLTKVPGNEGSVGILPEMSFVFANFEMIQGIRYEKLTDRREETDQTKVDNQKLIFSN
jgi:hypothetical protein